MAGSEVKKVKNKGTLVPKRRGFCVKIFSLSHRIQFVEMDYAIVHFGSASQGILIIASYS